MPCIFLVSNVLQKVPPMMFFLQTSELTKSVWKYSPDMLEACLTNSCIQKSGGILQMERLGYS